MARPVRMKPTFDPGKPTFVRRPFRAGGRRMERGEEFNWRDQMVTPRRARQMYDAGQLCHHDIEPEHAEPRPTVADEAAQQVAADDDKIFPPDGLEELTVAELREIAELEGAKKGGNRSDVMAAIREGRAAERERGDE